MTESIFLRHLAELRATTDTLAALDAAVRAAAGRMTATLSAGGTVYFCGNGGSAAEAQHLAGELTGRFVADRRPLAAVALGAEAAALTAIANDYAYEQVYARPLRALARRGDTLVVLSTSGNSPNVVRAVEAAREIGVGSVGLLGRDGGAVARLCDVPIVVAGEVTARIQEAHLLIGHALCAMVEAGLGVYAAASPRASQPT